MYKELEIRKEVKKDVRSSRYNAYGSVPSAARDMRLATSPSISGSIHDSDGDNSMRLEGVPGLCIVMIYNCGQLVGSE